LGFLTPSNRRFLLFFPVASGVAVAPSSATAAAVTSAVACFAAKGKMLWQLLDASS
jgi:hypothetical protein